MTYLPGPLLLHLLNGHKTTLGGLGRIMGAAEASLQAPSENGTIRSWSPACLFVHSALEKVEDFLVDGDGQKWEGCLRPNCLPRGLPQSTGAAEMK